ncbi:deoxynucleoside kinase [Priestia endophytica]|uniref:deoxynucleoside kinase n=1 Tax=Priestia endophytica TaxID=135735 RepID=UPI003D2AB441
MKSAVSLVVGGMIGGGKSSLTELIANEYDSIAYYESTDSLILEKFYTASPEEAQARRYPFLLQLEFLAKRFHNIKLALTEGNPILNVQDRSIYEDWYFCYINHKMGKISEIEFKLYENLLHEMMAEIDELPKKAPDLMIYLKGTFEAFLERIGKRGREFEQDEELMNYFYTLWSTYDDWLYNHYDKSEVLVIDIDKYDFVNREEDKAAVLEMIDNKLSEMGLL